MRIKSFLAKLRFLQFSRRRIRDCNCVRLAFFFFLVAAGNRDAFLLATSSPKFRTRISEKTMQRRLEKLIGSDYSNPGEIYSRSVSLSRMRPELSSKPTANRLIAAFRISRNSGIQRQITTSSAHQLLLPPAPSTRI